MLVTEIFKIIWFYFKRSIGQWKECTSAIKLTVREFYSFDRKFKVNTIGFSTPKGRSQYSDSVIYQTSGYAILEKIFHSLKLNKNDVFVDLGCGKGRVLILAGFQKIKKGIGIELDKNLVDVEKQNIKNLNLETEIEVLHKDATTFDCKEGTVFFMFNPFGWKSMKKILENIQKSTVINPRKVSIVYLNPVYGNLLDACDWLIAKGEINNTGAFLWHSKSI